MSKVVLRNKNSKVRSWVIDVPEGADPDAFGKQLAETWSDEGWSLDKKTDPADVPPDLEPAEPVNPEGN